MIITTFNDRTYLGLEGCNFLTDGINLTIDKKIIINLRNLCEERVWKWLPLGILGNTKHFDAIGRDKKKFAQEPNLKHRVI